MHCPQKSEVIFRVPSINFLSLEAETSGKGENTDQAMDTVVKAGSLLFR